MAMLLRLAYDGEGFAGAALQPGVRTVAGEVLAALGRLGEPDARVDVASRTDAGVHARGQVVAVEGLSRPDPERLVRGLRQQLPVDLCVTGVALGRLLPAPKTYVYRLDLAPWPDPWLRRTHWAPPTGVDPGRLTAAWAQIVGTRDWRAFARRGDTRGDLVRTLRAASVAWEGPRAALWVTGDGFPYRLVRSLVGGVVEVARGIATTSAWEAALAGESGTVASQQAPAHGLCLEGIALEATWRAP
jgi:tRNA pseudouridine38-40 synthase